MRLIDCRMGKGAVRQGSDNGQRKHQRASRSAIPELSPHRCAVEGTFSKPAIYADFEEGVSLMSETRRRWSEDEIAKVEEACWNASRHRDCRQATSKPGSHNGRGLEAGAFVAHAPPSFGPVRSERRR